MFSPAYHHLEVPAESRFPVTFDSCELIYEQEPVPGAVVLRVEAGLFYFNVQTVKNEILQRVRQQPGTTVVIMDLSTTANIDLAAARMLRDVYDLLEKNGIVFQLDEVRGYVRDLLRAEDQRDRIVGVEERLGIAELLARRTSIAFTA